MSATPSWTPATTTPTIAARPVLTAPPVPSTAAPVDTTTAAPVEATTAAPVETTAPTAPETTVATAAETAAVVNQSSCRRDLPDAAMIIVIPDIGYSCPVYAGDQKMLDSGAVTLITRNAPVHFANRPGDPGTLWIAGHHESHGAPFALVPNLADGAIITVSDGNSSARYQVVGREDVTVNRAGYVVDASGQPSASATWDAVGRPDRMTNTAPRLLLQTCTGTLTRVMIYADLVTI